MCFAKVLLIYDLNCTVIATKIRCIYKRGKEKFSRTRFVIMHRDMQKSIRLRYNTTVCFHFKSLIFILYSDIFKLINCVPANYQEEPLSRGQRPVKIYILSIQDYILMYTRPVCLITFSLSLFLARIFFVAQVHISYNYMVLYIYQTSLSLSLSLLTVLQFL